MDTAAWAFVSRDKRKAILSIIALDKHSNALTAYVRIRGIKPDVVYRCVETGALHSGAALIHAGYPVPIEVGEYKAWQFHFEAQ